MHQVTYSILSVDALMTEVFQAYVMDAPVACQLLRRGLHDTYLMTTGNGRYIARVYRARWRRPSDVAYELELLTYLAAQGLSVAVPIPGRDGCLSRPLAAPEGSRQLVLFPYVEGTPLSWKKEEHCYLAGKLLATIHTASDNFTSQHARLRIDLEHLIDAPLAAMQAFLSHRPEDWRYLEQLAHKLRERAQEASKAGLDWGVCHGDMSSGKIQISDGPTCTALDFDRCGLGWRAYDLAAIQWVAMGDETGRIWDSCIKGYTETRALAATDLAAVQVFHATCHLVMLGMYAENATDWGALRLSDSLFDRELAFFRKWEAKKEEPRATARPGGAARRIGPANRKHPESTRPATNPLPGASAIPEPRVLTAPGASNFPVAHSIVTADAVVERVARAYAIATPATCRLLKASLNDTYLLTTTDDRYIARVYGARWRTPSDVAYELELLTHLASKGVSAAVPILAGDGALSCPLPTPEGVRRLALFTYAPGAPLTWEKEEHCYLAGQMAATIHAASDDFVSYHARFRLDLEYLIETRLAMVQPFLVHRPDDWSYLQGFVRRLSARAAAAADAGLDWGPCHGDFSAKNIHLAPDRTVTALDFDFCGPGWRVYDLAPTYRTAQEQRKGAIWEAFLKGYTDTRHLSASDLAAVPLFHAISRVRSLGMRASIVNFRGTLAIGEYLDSYLKFFRKWEGEHLKGEAKFSASRGANATRKAMPANLKRRESAGEQRSVLSHSGSLPVIHSTFAVEVLLAEVAQAYAIDTPTTCRLLKASLNDTYLLTARDSRYIARVYGAHWRSPPAVSYELELLAYLAEREVSVPVALPLRNKTLMRALPAPEGTRQLVLFPYVEGTALSWNEEAHCYRAGKLLAAIHAASEEFESWHTRFRLDLSYLIDEPLRAIRPFLKHRPDDWMYLEGFAGRLRARAEETVQAGLDWGLCHGDFGAGNINIAPDGTATVLDFDFCGPGWRVYDFSSVHRAAADQKNAALWESFLKGYTETRRLGQRDLAAVTLFRVLRHLAMIGTFATNATQWGTERISERNLDKHLAYCHQWEAEYRRGI